MVIKTHLLIWKNQNIDIHWDSVNIIEKRKETTLTVIKKESQLHVEDMHI